MAIVSRKHKSLYVVFVYVRLNSQNKIYPIIFPSNHKLVDLLLSSINSLISKSRQINTLLKIQNSKRAMEEQFKHFLVYATRGRGLQIALVTGGISIASLGTLCILNRQKSSRVVTEEIQSEIPDADSKPLFEKSLDMKDATISATKKIFQNPEDSKND